MTPQLLEAIIRVAPDLIAQIIALLKLRGHSAEAGELAEILRRSDALADLLIANAEAALNPPE